MYNNLNLKKSKNMKCCYSYSISADADATSLYFILLFDNDELLNCFFFVS